MTKSNWMIRTTAALFIVAAAPFAAFASDEHYLVDGVAIGGFDTVAYHTVGAPTPGSAEFTAEYQGATWQFASA